MGFWTRRYDIFIICNRRHSVMLDYSKSGCYGGYYPVGARIGKPKGVAKERTGETSHSDSLSWEIYGAIKT